MHQEKASLLLMNQQAQSDKDFPASMLRTLKKIDVLTVNFLLLPLASKKILAELSSSKNRLTKQQRKVKISQSSLEAEASTLESN